MEEEQLLSEKNKHELDRRISFVDNGHIYYIDGNSKGIISCTTLIHKFFKPFNATLIIKNIQESEKYKTDSTYKYYKKTMEQIKKEWNTTAVLGTKLHHMIELYYNNFEVEYEDDSDFTQFLNFEEDHKDIFEIYRTEWKIYSDILKISGSIDAVFKNPDGTISLVDWKRTPEIMYKSFDDKKGKQPLENVPDCNFYHYSLQINLYRVILEKYYNQTVKDMFLVVLYPNLKYKKLEVKNMDTEIEAILEYRKVNYSL